MIDECVDWLRGRVEFQGVLFSWDFMKNAMLKDATGR